jgi:hypothetical protein
VEAFVLEIVPMSLAEAKVFIEKHHRHHIPPVGHKFSIGVSDGERVVGVATVGRPVARHYDDSWTLEVNRVATDGTKNACSALYAAAWRAGRALGYKRLITYTLEDESGASLRGAGWTVLHTSPGGSWSCGSRPRVDKHPLQKKICWEAP